MIIMKTSEKQSFDEATIASVASYSMKEALEEKVQSLNATIKKKQHLRLTHETIHTEETSDETRQVSAIATIITKQNLSASDDETKTGIASKSYGQTKGDITNESQDHPHMSETMLKPTPIISSSFSHGARSKTDSNRLLWIPDPINDSTMDVSSTKPSETKHDSHNNYLGYLKMNFCNTYSHIKRRGDFVTKRRLDSRIQREAQTNPVLKADSTEIEKQGRSCGDCENKDNNKENKHRIRISPSSKTLLEDKTVFAFHEEYQTEENYYKQYNSSLTNLIMSPNQSEKKIDARHVGQTNRIKLVISIGKLIFYNHPKRNEEEKLDGALWEVYQEYNLLKENMVCSCKRLISQLSQVRKLQGDFSQMTENSEQEKTHEAMNCNMLLKNLISTVSMILSQKEEMKELESQLIAQWETLRSSRENKQFHCTSTILKMKKVNLREQMKVLFQNNKNDMNSYWNRENEVHYKTLLSYISHQNLVDVTTWLLLVVSRRRATDNGEKLYDDENELLDKLKILCRNGEEFILNHVMSHDTRWVATIPKDLMKEQERRKTITSERYFARLLINRKFVCRTKAKNLHWPSFSILFEKKFECRVLEKPKHVSIEIVRERGNGFLPEKILRPHFVEIPVFPASKDNEVKKTQADDHIWYSFTASIAISKTKNKSHVANGAISMSVQWEGYENKGGKKPAYHDTLTSKDAIISLHSVPLFPIRASQLCSSQHSGLHIPGIQKYTTNYSVDKRSKHYSEWKSTQTPPFNFKNRNGKYLHSKESIRHRLLKIREVDPKSVVSPIPLEDKFIIFDESYQHVLSQERSENMSNKEREEPLKLRRLGMHGKRLHNFIKRVQMYNLFEKNKMSKRRRYTSEFVREISYFQQTEERFCMRELIIFLLPSRTRSLRPVVKLREISRSTESKKYSILVTIVGAKNIPRRCVQSSKERREPRTSRAFKQGEEIQSKFDSHFFYDNENNVNSFAKVLFQDSIVKSRKVNGSSPLWKQTLEIPLVTENNDFSPTCLMHLRNEIVITVFDEITIDLADAGGYYDDEYTTQKENRYLGECRIPFHTLYMNGRIEGSISLKCPHIFLGYTKKRISLHETKNMLNNSNGQLHTTKDKTSHRMLTEDSELDTNLKIIVTMHPFFVAPRQNSLISFMREETSLVNFAGRWIDRYKKITKNTLKRTCEVLVPDVNGFGWLICRFMKAQAPPPECDSIYKCAYFISLIPSFHDLELTAGKEDMWCTHQQFLDRLVGNHAEHATLLAGYFMWLSNQYPEKAGADIFLVLGTGIPEGKTVYVMHTKKSDGRITMWNAVTGKSYSLNDENCQLQNIECIVTSKNIFGNIQNKHRPNRIDFDLRNRKLWFPFYSDNNPPPKCPLPSIQETKLNYIEPNEYFASELQDELIDTLRSSIRSLRRGPTSFRIDVSHRLSGILDLLEQSLLNGKCISQVNYFTKIDALTKGKSLFGFPLHFSSVDLSEIVKRVKETCIYQSKHPDVEFALAVRVFPYSSNVISVWVFICSISPA